MKSVLKWSSLPFAILAVTVAVYILVSAINMMPGSPVNAIALLIASTVFIGGGPVVLSAGAFKESRTLSVIGVIVLVFGVVLIFASRAINLGQI